MKTQEGLNRRELIKQVLRGIRVARLPRAIFGGGLWSYRQAGLAIEELKDDPVRFGNRLSDVWTELDTDIVFLGSGMNTLPAEAIGGEIRFRGEQAPLLSFPIIQRAEDARYFDPIDLQASPYTAALIAMIAQVRRRLPDRYLCATSWGPFTWGMILCDWNLLKEKASSDQEFIRDVCELGIRLSLAFFHHLADRGLIDGISIPDGAVTLIPNELYRDIVLPCEKRLFDLARESGAACFLHQCGNIAPQIELYPETGADCITVDAGVQIGEVYGLYHNRVVTAGNVDVINVVYGGDQAKRCEAVSACIAAVKDPYTRYILMPSCDLPPDTPLRNVREFLSCADRVG